MNKVKERTENRKILNRVSKSKEMRRLVNVIYSTASDIELVAKLVSDNFSDIEVDGITVTDHLVEAGLQGYSKELYKKVGRIDLPNLQRIDGFIKGVSVKLDELSNSHESVSNLNIDPFKDLVPEKLQVKFMKFGYSEYE